ncbi:clostripain-related cysteine peptidase [Candidatus Chloroploca asiatica]|uniref:Uncharacterized protein n=1 Tax=Candidatus Chloroploca asiatica TaxID=1506545 RepID=A0A2H3KL73_9CHLR|nr:clostripain-related cysteine peptidase [Candidatus Chloroploca asiatica]PDV98008.1 hypothetical protein A9Q02_16580 [Candidatus Chloroploca asiatica]
MHGRGVGVGLTGRPVNMEAVMLYRRCLPLVLVILVALGLPLLVPQAASMAVPPVLNKSLVLSLPVVPESISLDLRSPTALGLSTTALPQVVAGGNTTCVINLAGQLYCWGASSNVPADLGVISQVSIGRSKNDRSSSFHICAVTLAGEVRCWGGNGSGQATVPDDLGAVRQVSAGGHHTCVVRADGILRCWGANTDLNGTYVAQATVPSDLGVVSQVSAGEYHTCVVRVDGTVRCWGLTKYGQAMVPSNLGTVRQVSAGWFHTCAVTTAGALRCWGANTDLNGTYVGQATVPGDLGAVSHVSAGAGHTCAVTTAGALRCWGSNIDTDWVTRKYVGQATVPSDLGAVSHVSAGEDHTCAVTVDGALRCWGGNLYGQATVPGDLDAVSQVTTRWGGTCAVTAGALRCWGANWYGQAEVPADLGAVRQVSEGGEHTCAVTTDGALRCWGYNRYGQATVPDDLGAVSQVSAREYHTCAVTADGAVRCWGDNGSGQAMVPDDLGAVRQVSTSSSHTCGVTTDGVLRCWGYNQYGEATVPGDLGAVSQVSAGKSYTCAVTTDGVLRCWGHNQYGEATVPGDLGAVSQVSAGEYHTCAVTTSGTLRCWGWNDYFQATVPGALGAVNQVSVGGYHTCAVTADGAVRCWGNNWYGQTTIPRDPLKVRGAALLTGQVTLHGLGLADVRITDGTRTVTTTATGAYTLTDVPYGTYVLTPTLAGYTFTPATRMITVTGDLDGQDFVATLQTFPVRGHVTVDGVGLAEVVITDGTRSATTDSTGAYTLTDVPYGTHVLTPTLAGYTFSPVTRTITVTAALAGQDFAATLRNVALPQVIAGGYRTCVINRAGQLSCWGHNSDVPSDLGAVRQVSLGWGHMCAVMMDGVLRCWGRDDDGQAIVPDELGAVSQVSAGSYHTCAVTTDRTLRCWGRNTQNGIFIGQATVPSDLGAVSQVIAGDAHTCAVTVDGALRCWGNNGNGQATVPGGLGPVSQVSAGTWHTCAVTTDGALRCWGYNGNGQATVPDDLGVVSHVSLGSDHTCAVMAGGALHCWGSNQYGQATVPGDLGAVDQVSSGKEHTCAVTVAGVLHCWGNNNLMGEVTVPGDLGAVDQVSAGKEHTCAVTVSGVLHCWGSNGNRLYTTRQATVPADLGAVDQVSAGDAHTCAVTTDGVLHCWGQYRTVPSDLGAVSQVSAGSAHTCALTTDGVLRCWPENIHDGATVPADLGAVSQVSVGGSHTCALTTDGVLRCWGWNLPGQTDVPDVPGDLGAVRQVSVGNSYACAVTADGALRCWGSNAYGKTDVPGDLGAVDLVSAGREHTCAVTVNGVLRCWGSNGASQATVPGDLGAVTQVSLGEMHTCAVTVDGVLRCWGSNEYGQTTVPRDPLKVRGIALLTGQVTVNGLGLADVRITDGTRTVTTTAMGAYTLTDVPYGTHVLTPTLAGYTFIPANRTITVSGDLDGQDFAATLLTFPVTGRVTLDGVGLADVVITDGTRSATTDSTGVYTLADVPYGTHVLTPTLAGYTFTPTTRTISVTEALRNQNFAATRLTFPVTGRVTVDGVGLADVVITDGTRSATTDSTGAYTLADVPYGTHGLSAMRAGYTFTPAIRTVMVTEALAGQNFAATRLTFPVTGRVTVDGVGLADVVITDGTRTATTDSTGAYTLAELPYGSYVLTPTLAGYTFTPAQRTVLVRQALGGQDFAATQQTFSVTGRVTVEGVGLASVSISDGTRTAATDANGYYTLSSVPAGIYTLTPSRSGYSFSPTSLSVTVSSSLTNQDFTATLLTYSVSGRITSGGVGLADVTVSNGTYSAISDGSGNYNLSTLQAGSYTLTATKAGCSFIPSSVQITLPPTTSDHNFTAMCSTPEATWTMLLYLAGDIEDGGKQINAFTLVRNRLRQHFRNSSVRIAIQIDGPGSNDTRRYLISPGTETTAPQETEILIDEQAMDTPQSLEAFLLWGQEQLPAQYYYLAIANHGQAIQGIAWDHTSDHRDGSLDNNAYLTPVEIRQALSAPGVEPIAVLHLDACSMNLIEVAYEVRNQARLLIASQYISWSYYAYDEYQRLITSATTPADLARGITISYASRARADKNPFTISALDLQRVEPVAAAVNALAAELKGLVDADQGYAVLLDEVWRASRKFTSNQDYFNNEDDEYIDLLDWTTRIRATISTPGVQTHATTLITELTGPQPFILKDAAFAQSNALRPQWGGGAYIDLTNSSGVSIFYPQRHDSVAFDHYINDRLFTFSKETRWKDFLLAGVGPLPPPGENLRPLPGPLAPLDVEYRVFLPLTIR